MLNNILHLCSDSCGPLHLMDLAGAHHLHPIYRWTPPKTLVNTHAVCYKHVQ